MMVFFFPLYDDQSKQHEHEGAYLDQSSAMPAATGNISSSSSTVVKSFAMLDEQGSKST